MELRRNSRSPVVSYSPSFSLPWMVRSRLVAFPIETLVGVDRAPPRIARTTMNGSDSGSPAIVINHLPAPTFRRHDDAGR